MINYTQKKMTLKHVTYNSFPWNKAGDFRIFAILCPKWQMRTKIRSKLHARDNAQATLHPNKDIFKQKKHPALNQSLNASRP